MKIYGGIYFNEDGLSTAIRGMHLQTELLAQTSDNINGFNKIGYQKSVPVLSSFAQYIGVHALSNVKDTSVGRLKNSGNPLDFALAKEGYFQYKTPQGIKLTRDGRFQLDKNGNLLTLENFKVLGMNGQPIRFKKCPKQIEDIKVGQDGVITSIDPDKNEVYEVGQLSVVSDKGISINDVDVRQKFVEQSNVSLQSEFMSLVPVRRNFEANRQSYIIQNDELTKTIQELGRA